MDIVIDTNILVNALKSSKDDSKAAMLLEDVFWGVHRVYYSDLILNEYEEVLRRPHLKIAREDIEEVLGLIIEFRIKIDPKSTTQKEVEMRDEDDRIFFDVAKCANARLVTRNYKDYPVHELVTLIDEIY